MQILTGNIERSLSEKDVNFTCFVKNITGINPEAFKWGVIIASCMAKCRYVIGILRDKMDEILETIFSNKVVHIMARAQKTTCYYLNQWGLSLLTHTCSTRPRWVKANKTQYLILYGENPPHKWSDGITVTRSISWLYLISVKCIACDRTMSYC